MWDGRPIDLNRGFDLRTARLSSAAIPCLGLGGLPGDGMTIQVNMRPFGNQDHGGSPLNRGDRQIARDIVCFVDTQCLLRDLDPGAVTSLAASTTALMPSSWS